MKIIAFMRGYVPNVNTGAALMTADILEALVEAGHDVTVYSYTDEDSVVNGVKVCHYDKLNKPEFPKYDMVYTHPDLGSIGPKTVTNRYAPLVGMVHNTEETTLAAIEKHSMRYTLLIYNSRATAEFFDEFPGIVVHSPLNVEDYKVDRRGAKYITLINQSGAKGVELFWKLAHRMPEYKFLAVEGAHGVQYVRDNIPNITNLKFVGHEDITSVYAKTRVLLTPSSHESWGRVAAEAMCSGIPVVSTPTPGLQECIGDGVFLNRRDVDGWEAEIRKLMSDPVYYKKRSAHGKTRVRQIEKQSQEELKFFVDNVVELCKR